LLRFAEIPVFSSDVYRFGDFTLDVRERRLLQGSETVRLPPKSFDVLVTLIHEQGRLVTKRDLLARVWPDTFVEEGILTVHVSALRKAFGDDAAADRWIETVPRAGYRFNGLVSRVRTDVVGRDPGTPVEAYEFVGAGRAHLLSGSSTEMPEALSAFRAALAVDPECAPAYAGLAITRCTQAYFRSVPHTEAYAEAKASARRALAIDDGSADAQAALGAVQFLSEWNWAAADRSLRRALEIDPDHTEALLQYGALNDALGNGALGLRLKQQALARAAHSPLLMIEIALSFAVQRRFDDTIAWIRKALALDPKNLRAAEFLTATCFLVGDLPALMAEKRRSAEVFGLSSDARAAMERDLCALQEVHSRGGKLAVWRQLIEHSPNRDDSRSSMRLAVLHGAVGDLDAAFCHLERAVTLRDPHLVYLGVYAIWDPLRDDPRMAKVLARIGLPTQP
jgi:DNA-binding winged helix-turn-helix (wHTH) protein